MQFSLHRALRAALSVGAGLAAATMLFPGFLYSDAEAATTATLGTPAIADGTAMSQFPTDPIPQSLIPVKISIPSAHISSSIVGVGVNAKREMDVPAGTTNDVGWYKYGAKPGQTGTAVFDAHVFAAFQNLSQVKVGSDIYITTDDGGKLHFKVTKVATYKLSQLTPPVLFARTSSKDINLITCAGTFVPSIGTYDHRLIVSATLVS